MTITSAPKREPFEHPALYYDGLDEYLKGTVRFVEDGLGAGEAVAAVVPEPNLTALREALGPLAEHIHLTDMAEVGANPGRLIPEVLHAFADDHAGRRVRIVGEPVWRGRSDAEYAACAQHEALINLAFTGREATILCPYDTGGLNERAIADSHATHPVLLDATGPRPSPVYDPMRVVRDYNRPIGRRPRIAVERGVDRHTVDHARWFVTAYGARHGLSAHRLIDLEIAVTELLTNSVVHGGGEGLLRIWLDAEHLVAEVADAGHVEDPLAGRRPVAPESTDGRGLLLVHQVADLVHMHTGPAGTTTRVHLRLGEP